MSTTDALTHKTSWDYDAAGNMKKETRPDLKFRTWDIYDATNRIKQTTGFLGEHTSYVYDLAGNMTQMTDAKGAIYRFGYDLLNRKTIETYPIDARGAVRTETWSYDAAGHLYQYKTPYGWLKTFTYDNRNRPTSASWNTNYAGTVGTATTYDAASRVTGIDSGTTTVAFGYDNANHQTSETQYLAGYPAHTVSTTPDVDGNRASLSAAGVYSLSYDYTQRQQLAHINLNGAPVTPWFQYSYDPNGNLSKRQNVYQGLDSTSFTYDQANRVNSVNQTGHNDALFARSLYGYDVLNNLTNVTRDEENSAKDAFGYDYANQLTSATYNATPTPTPTPPPPTPTPPPPTPTPTPRPVITVQPAPRTVMVGQTAAFSVTATGAPPLHYQWRKNAGNISGATAASYTTPATTMADNGALFSVVVNNGGGSVTSNNARLTVTAAPTPTPPPPTPTPTPRVTAPVFNPPGQSHGTHPASQLIVYLSTTTSGAQMRYNVGSNPADPTSSSGTLINGTSGTVTILSNKLWQLKAVAFKSGWTTSTITSRTYNTTDPTLEPEEQQSPAPEALTSPPRRTVSYSLDSLNRRSMNDSGVVTNYTYTSNGMNQFTTVGGQSPVYDGDFHLYSYSGWTYVYDADGRLTSTTATGHSAQFVYDGLGRCVKRTIDGVITLFTYDGWKPIAEWNSAGARVAWNIYGPGADEILERYQVGIGYTHYHADRQGNVMFLLNVDGYGLERYSYDAFGQPRITDWAGNLRTDSAYGNRFMFTGREYLTTLGIYDYRHRYYHPGLGRFLEVDPTGFGAGDANLFRYVGNNPVNASDPSGLVGIPPIQQLGNGDFQLPDTGQSGRITVTGEPVWNFDPGWESYSSEGALGVFTQGGQGPPVGSLYVPRTYQPLAIVPRGGFGLGSLLPRTPYSPPNPTLPDNPFAPPKTDASRVENKTYFIGMNLSFIPIAGGTVSAGIYFAPTGTGLFASGGPGQYMDNSVSVTAGYVNGGRELLASPFTNQNVSVVFPTLSVHNDPITGGEMGRSYGLSLGVPPISMSETYTNTIATPAVVLPVESLIYAPGD